MINGEYHRVFRRLETLQYQLRDTTCATAKVDDPSLTTNLGKVEKSCIYLLVERQVRERAKRELFCSIAALSQSGPRSRSIGFRPLIAPS